MPVLIRGDSNMIVMPLSYSPAAIERSFQVVDEITLAGKRFLVIFDKQTPRAAIVKADIEEIDGVARHIAVAMLELANQKSIGDNVISVERFWEETDLLQVEGVCVERRYQEAGFATRLYEALVINCGVILMSDNTQYQGGKALWQKIARESKELSVFVLDTDSGRFYPYDGTKVIYDGSSIPEEKIWSEHPDTTRFGVVLIAEDKKKIDKLASN
ncbi:hypothetical protein RHD99_20970 [Buttiauxella selenatireducens]|uniref:N-acetyltransferase n=1 Tax=Buttiauxella selenatireducens TaxID=3073902 RepID=A0ABY9S8N5_9ENTR|nr:hypothetical protein [Buttiauxella sp. R73]WMY73878.1 hypothetical protein RHD99_20970 [Buttiauxella sp. R73]